MSAKHWALAADIEMACAAERVRLKRRGGRSKAAFKAAVAAEYDPHAASELAMLMEARLS